MTINTQPTIEVNEFITDRIQQILEIAQEYGLEEVIKGNLIVSSSADGSKLEYTLAVPNAKFREYPDFQMKLNEVAYTNSENLSVTHLRSYSYHGFHKKNPKDPSIHFIRFDFEPFKEKYAPVHINVYKQKWGDHLTFPDSTNLDISKMSCPIAVRVFNRYARDKKDFPVNQENNQPYVEIINNRR